MAKTTKKESKPDITYVLDLIDNINKDLSTLRNNLDTVSGNVNYALDKIEEIEPRFIQAVERLGL